MKQAKTDSPLKELRSKLGLTQQDLATLADVPQSHISKVEKGHDDLGDGLEAFLTDLGSDVATLEKRQRAFMKSEEQALKAGLPDLRAKVAMPGSQSGAGETETERPEQ